MTHLKKFGFATMVFLLIVCASAYATDAKVCMVAESQTTEVQQTVAELPYRSGPRVRTSGRVPHVQIGVSTNDDIKESLFAFAFSMPGVEERPTIVSLRGTAGMWLDDSVPVIKPKAIVAGREFSHIHTDGSLHLPLPLARALELSEKGWGERHPWAQSRDGWEGLVMVYTPDSIEQLKIVGQLIAESYNYVTGQQLRVGNC